MKSLNLENEYEILKPSFQRFKNALIDQLDNIIEQEKVSLGFPIQSRIKTLESIIDKQNSGRFNIKKSLTELQDIVGFRIILIFKKDVDVICNLINQNLEVLKEYNSEGKLLENQFGYSSIHFVVKIPNGWANVPTFKGLESNVAEIQIRTLSQHIWAEASKELQYKQEQSIPRELLRSISRASALLETVDLEFDRLLEDREKYIKEIETENINQTLNVDLLASFLDSKLPPENKKSHEPYFGLLSDLESFEILTISDLNKLFNEYLKEVLEQDKITAKELIKYKLSRNPNYYYSHVGLVRMMLKSRDNKKFESLNQKNES